MEEWLSHRRKHRLGLRKRSLLTSLFPLRPCNSAALNLSTAIRALLVSIPSGASADQGPDICSGDPTLSNIRLAVGR
jgi:hypothetical protein